MKQNRWFVLCGFLVLCLAVGGVAGAFTASAVTTWYPTLNKPSFNPPNWIFAPVWTVLYVLMAVAAWRAWLKGAGIASGLGWFYAQLALNFAWSFLFFQAHAIDLALIEIMVLWVAIAATLHKFWRFDKVAGQLFIPYLAWVSFAVLLNASLWGLNP